MSLEQIEKIARIAHEVNSSYCQGLANTAVPPMSSWEACDEAHKNSVRTGVALVLSTPDSNPWAQHAGWMAQKLAEGWTPGPVKNVEKKTHPDLVPFEELPATERAKSYIFRAVVLAAAELLGAQ